MTVSLGAHCPLACAHCYTTAPSFRVDRKRSVEDALTLVEQFPSARVICLSGDTDPFLRPAAAVDFLERAATEFPGTHLMYTTRLIPPPDVEHRLLALGERLAAEDRLCVAAVSLVSPELPNDVEDERRVASPRDRQSLLARLGRGSQPVMLALRPTFPFAIVPKHAVSTMISEAAGSADVVLGEILLLDPDGAVADALGLAREAPSDTVGTMTFLSQPRPWRKRRFSAEADFAASVAATYSLPYFLRSVSAMRYFERYWDLRSGKTSYRPGDELDTSVEAIAP